jgi:hypothetical protein
MALAGTFVERARALAQHGLDARERDVPAAAGQIDQVAPRRARHREHAWQARVLQIEAAEIGDQGAGEGRVFGSHELTDVAGCQPLVAACQPETHRLAADIGHQ